MNYRAVLISILFTATITSHEASSQDLSGKFVCCLKAVRTEREASQSVSTFSASGLDCSYLWIPDYDGLSGKELYLVYGGPFNDKVAANAYLEEAKAVLGTQGFYVKNVGRKVDGYVAAPSADDRRAYAVADAELNRVYKLVMASLTPAEQDVLRSIQRQWIKSRDSNCERASAPYAGEASFSAVRTRCLTEETRRRTQELLSYRNSSVEQTAEPATSVVTTPVTQTPPAPAPAKPTPKPLKKSLYLKLDGKGATKKP